MSGRVSGVYSLFKAANGDLRCGDLRAGRPEDFAEVVKDGLWLKECSEARLAAGGEPVVPPKAVPALRLAADASPERQTMRGRCVYMDQDTLLRKVCGQPKGGVKCTYACDHPDDDVRALHSVGCIPLRQWQPEAGGGCPNWSDVIEPLP